MLTPISRFKKYLLRVAPVMAFLCGVSGASLAQSDLCIPSLGGLATAPTIDGRVEGDPGWNGAMRVNLKEALGVPRVGTMQIGSRSGFLYISLEVEGTPTPGYEDLVVLGFHTTTNAAQDWRVHIHPFEMADVGSVSGYLNHNPRTRDYWRNSATWNLNTSAGGTADTPSTPFIGDIKVARNQNNWSMEMKIPTTTNIALAGGATALYLPSSPTTFKFYVNVLSTFDLAGTFTQDSWPQTVAMLTASDSGSGGNYAANRTPAPTGWATTSTFSRSACNGVYMAWNASNGVRHSPTGAIGNTSLTGPGPFKDGTTVITTPAQCVALLDDTSWPTGTILPNNYFVAKPGNDGPPADRVYVRFYVAPWGIPGLPDSGTPNAYWHPIGELFRPASQAVVDSTPETTIPSDVGGVPALAAPLSTPSWQLSYKQACVYTKSDYYGSVGHHCIQIEVHSNDPSVVIRNKSIQINHNFVEASTAKMDAAISLRGRGPQPAGQSSQKVLLLTSKSIENYKRDGDRYYPSPQSAGVKTEARLAAGLPSAQLSAQFRAYGPVSAERYPKGLTQGMTAITNAYLEKGDYIIIGNRHYRYAQYIGGFSYFAGHNGIVKNWTDSMALGGAPGAGNPAGTELTSLDGKVLGGMASPSVPVEARLLQMPAESTVDLGVRVQAQEEQIGCKCGDPSCLLKGGNVADAGSGTTIAGLFLIGLTGIGGFAFLRRRKGIRRKTDQDRLRA